MTDHGWELFAVALEEDVDVTEIPGVDDGVELPLTILAVGILAGRRLVFLVGELHHHLPPLAHLRTHGVTVSAETLVHVVDAFGIGERDELRVHLRVVTPGGSAADDLGSRAGNRGESDDGGRRRDLEGVRVDHLEPVLQQTLVLHHLEAVRAVLAVAAVLDGPAAVVDALGADLEAVLAILSAPDEGPQVADLVADAVLVAEAVPALRLGTPRSVEADQVHDVSPIGRTLAQLVAVEGSEVDAKRSGGQVAPVAVVEVAPHNQGDPGLVSFGAKMVGCLEFHCGPPGISYCQRCVGMILATSFENNQNYAHALAINVTFLLSKNTCNLEVSPLQRQNEIYQIDTEV